VASCFWNQIEIQIEIRPKFTQICLLCITLINHAHLLLHKYHHQYFSYYLCVGHCFHDTISLSQWLYLILNLLWLASNLFIIYSNNFYHLFLIASKEYGGYSANLLFHIIISELQYIIPDSSPKILSGCKNYLLGAFIYWATFIYWAMFIYSGCIYLCLFWLLMFAQTNTPWFSVTTPVCLHRTPNHTLQASLLSLNPHACARSPKVTPYTINCNVTVMMPDSAQLNRKVSGLTLLQQHHPNLTCPKNNLVVLTLRLPPR